MLKLGHTILFLFVSMLSLSLFAQGSLPTVPDVDPFAIIVELFKNWKTLSPLAISISLVMVTMQVAKKVMADGSKYKGIVVSVLSVLYGVLISVVSGMSYLSALVLILLTNGGAVYLYEQIKAIWKAGDALILGNK